MFNVNEYSLIAQGLRTGSFYPDRPELDQRLHSVGELQVKIDNLICSPMVKAIIPVIHCPPHKFRGDFVKIFETRRELIVDLLHLLCQRKPLRILLAYENEVVAQQHQLEIIERLSYLILKRQTVQRTSFVFEGGAVLDFLTGTKMMPCGNMYDYAFIFNQEFGE